MWPRRILFTTSFTPLFKHLDSEAGKHGEQSKEKRLNRHLKLSKSILQMSDKRKERKLQQIARKKQQKADHK